jgi:hypothetical protein
MPCWDILGVTICIPSLDDIVNAVVTPITNFVTGSLASLIEAESSLWTTLTSSLGPFFDGVINSITGLLRDPLSYLQSTLGSVWGIVSSLGSQISDGLNWVAGSVSAGLSDLSSNVLGALQSARAGLEGSLAAAGAVINQGLVTAQNSIIGGINLIGAQMSEALETAEGSMLTAFDGMGNALSGIIGGVFSGFGSVDLNSVVGSALEATGQALSAMASLEIHHSPITPVEAMQFVPNFVNQVEAACVSLHIANTVAEGVSLGQIDVSLTEAWSYPNTKAAMGLATELAAMPITVGLMPAFKRYILASYVPMIPDFQSLISIYVKEGYLESHWVEMPADMAQNFRELGYSEDWAKRLWGQHWVYPNPTQLYEMLHRTAGNFPEIGVTADVLRNMLKLHDFEPMWRKPLEEISWRTWRIYDIRTGWEMDALGDEGLVTRLIDTGYEPKDARLVADIQKLTVMRSELDKLLTEADTDYTEGWIGEDLLRANYEATPYRKDIIDLRISRAKLRRDRDLKKDIKAALLDRYVKGDLTEAEYKQELSRLGITQEWITAEVTRADAKKLTKVKEETALATKGLTEARYSRAYKVGLIDEAEYTLRLQALKYDSQDIALLKELNTPEKPSPEEIPTLTLGELKAAFRAGVLSDAELAAELDLRRYNPEDIGIIIETERAKIKPTAAE